MTLTQQDRERICDELLAYTTFISPTGCLEYKGWKDSNGYGNFDIGDRTYAVHRFIAYTLFLKTEEEREQYKDHVTCHNCDNPPCIAPYHLFIGTISDNLQDAISKGLLPYANSKLDWDKVDEIRRLYTTSFVSQRTLAKQFGVTSRTISEIVNNRSWIRPRVGLMS